jgi:hypothetical protein
MQRSCCDSSEASVTDLLDDIREQITTRLGELRPVVDEHRRLEAALQALGEANRELSVAAPAGPPARTSARVPKAAPARALKRAPRGANRQALLRAVEERPGGTRAELAALSGIERNTLSALLARLVKRGELQTRALPTGRIGYALGDPRT